MIKAQQQIVNDEFFVHNQTPMLILHYTMLEHNCHLKTEVRHINPYNIAHINLIGQSSITHNRLILFVTTKKKVIKGNQ